MSQTPSPFTSALEQHRAGLAPALVGQYLDVPEDPYELVLSGLMRRVWHRPAWLWPVFWLLAQVNVIFPETGKDIPTQLVVRSGRDALGRPIHIWDRTFSFPGPVYRHYVAAMAGDLTAGRMVERMGPGRIMAEVAEVRCLAPGTLEFTTVESRLHLGPLAIRMPRRLWVTAHVVQEVDVDRPDTSRVTLTLVHGLLGPVFGYDGEFRMACRERPSGARTP